MNNILVLSKYFAKTLFREKIIVALIFILPVLLIFAGAASSPEGTINLALDNTIVTPLPESVEVSVVLYTITGVVLIASIVSFFLGYNLSGLVPRLQQMGYSSHQTILSFVSVMVLINTIMSIVVGLFSLIWIDVEVLLGFFIGLILSSIIFATLGLIIAELVNTTTLGLYCILSLAVLDTAFLENPLYSRRYNDDWISFMPSHESIQLIFRTIYDTGTEWTNNLVFIILYEMALILIYLLVSKYVTVQKEVST